MQAALSVRVIETAESIRVLKWMLLLGILCVAAGCSESASTTSQMDDDSPTYFDTVAPGSGMECYGRFDSAGKLIAVIHNYRRLHCKGWTYETWTDGSLSSPGEPIGVGFMIAIPPNLKGKRPVVELELRMRTPGKPDTLYWHKHDPDLDVVRFQNRDWFAVKIANAFPDTDNRLPQRSAVDIEGSYTIDFEITIEKAKLQSLGHKMDIIDRRKLHDPRLPPAGSRP